MIKLILTSLCICGFYFHGHTQNNPHSIRLSVPTIWNVSEASYYTLGQRRVRVGEAVSPGLNIAYSRSLLGKFHTVLGIGLLKQTFRIRRPANIEAPIQPMFHTKKYFYHNIHVFAGANYRARINAQAFLIIETTYNWLRSYKQKYKTDRSDYPQQTNREKLRLGTFVNTSLGVERIIPDRVHCGVAIVVPVDIKWNDDDMFVRYSYSDDTQRIAKNILSLGLNFSVRYDLD